MAASSCLFLATIYNQSQLAERKHMETLLVERDCGKSCSIKPAPLCHYEISGGHIGWGVCLEEVFCRLSTTLVLCLHRYC